MFRRTGTQTPGQAFSLSFDGRTLSARPGDSVAAALLAAGITRFRDTPASGAPRMAFCMMGICFDCLVTIDGVPNRQACLVAAAPGQRVESQSGAPVQAPAPDGATA